MEWLWVKVLFSWQPELKPRTHMVDGENQLLQVVLWPAHMCHVYGGQRTTPRSSSSSMLVPWNRPESSCLCGMCPSHLGHLFGPAFMFLRKEKQRHAAATIWPTKTKRFIAWLFIERVYKYMIQAVSLHEFNRITIITKVIAMVLGFCSLHILLIIGAASEVVPSSLLGSQWL